MSIDRTMLGQVYELPLRKIQVRGLLNESNKGDKLGVKLSLEYLFLGFL